MTFTVSIVAAIKVLSVIFSIIMSNDTFFPKHVDPSLAPDYWEATKKAIWYGIGKVRIRPVESMYDHYQFGKIELIQLEGIVQARGYLIVENSVSGSRNKYSYIVYLKQNTKKIIKSWDLKIELMNERLRANSFNKESLFF